MDYTGLVELESTAADSAAIGKGTFLLADIRETVESGGYAVTENGVTKNYKTYLVRRLADGNCWMVQNLDLNLKSFAGTNKLTSENTDLNSKTSWDPSASLVVAGGYNNALGEGNAKISNILEPGPGYSSPDVGQLSISDYQFQSRLYYGPNFYWGSRYTQGTTTDNPGTANNNGLVIVNNTNSAYPRSYNDGLGYIDGTSTEDGMIKIGNISGNVDKAQQQWASTEDTEWRPSYITDNNGESYTMRGSMYIGDFYNYYAATAESITYYMTSGSAQDTICPSGWTIPNAYLEKSFSVLMSDTYGIPNASNNVDIVKKTHLLPLSIPYTGAYNWATGSIDHNGYRGFFWAKGEYAQDTARNLGIHYTGDVSYGGASQRIAGVPIRCVNKGSNQETVVSTCAANSICYNSNGGSGSVETQTVEASETTATLASASALSRDGYVFAGWSTAPSGYGDIFGQNTETTVGDLTTSGLQLYAKWVKPELTMQGFTSARCSIMEENQKISLIDTRDSKIYGAIKLGDGECWMADDLAYTGSDGSYVTEYNDKIYYRANRFASKNPCPGGWSVPTKTQADAMLPYYENLSLSAVGGYYHGSIHNYEAAAFYWTSTPQTGGTLWYSISVRQTNVPIVSPGYGSDAGMFVRCIAQ